MSDPNPACEVVICFCFGGAKPDDRNFADIVAVDDEIVEWLARRERRKRRPLKSESTLRLTTPVQSMGVPDPLDRRTLAVLDLHPVPSSGQPERVGRDA
jgi:hypothetical protein